MKPGNLFVKKKKKKKKKSNNKNELISLVLINGALANENMLSPNDRGNSLTTETDIKQAFPVQASVARQRNTHHNSHTRDAGGK